MSIQLTVRRAAGAAPEFFPFTGSRSMIDHIRPLAQSLGLVCVPEFYTLYEIRPEELRGIIVEWSALERHMAGQPQYWGVLLENVRRIRTVLEELCDTTGWEADFG